MFSALQGGHKLGLDDAVRTRTAKEPTVEALISIAMLNRNLLTVAARSTFEVVFDELADDDTSPFNGWGEEVAVHEIASTVRLHDPLVIAPGLIDIAIWYSWMRAADVVDTPAEYKARAFEISDEIARVRAQNWDDTRIAWGAPLLARHKSFPVLQGVFRANVERRWAR